MGDGFGLLLAFDTDNPEFARGVELGRLYEMASDRDNGEIQQTIHATNAEMAMRVAEATGREFSAEPLDDDGHWVELFMGESATDVGENA